MQKVVPFLWFDTQAEEAADFYCSIFKNSSRETTERYGEDVPTPDGTITSVEFEIEGQRLIAFNGGPDLKFSPAISLMVDCKTQEEVDYYWEKLGEGGTPIQCGWLTDKFGLTWQIVPTALTKMLQDEDKVKAGRVMQAMMQMVKIDIAKLQEAYNG